MQKKYKLPPLEEVERTLGLYFSEPAPFISSMINSLIKKMAFPSNYVSSLLQPTSLLNVIESSFFTQKEKEDMFELASTCMSKVCLLEAVVFDGDGEKARIFNEVYGFFNKKVIPFNKKLLKKLSKKWVQKDMKKEMHNYFG